MKLHHVILAIMVAIMLSGCACNSKSQNIPTTPEERITVIAQQMTNLQMEYNQAIIAAYQEFLANFNTNIYESRVDARNMLNAKIESINNNYEIRKLEIEQKKIELLIELGYEEYLDIDINRYRYSREEKIVNYITLVNIYNNYIEEKECAQPGSNERAAEQLEEKCEQVINTLKPTEPNVDIFKDDLAGVSFREADGGYFGHCLEWTISEDDKLSIRILNTTDYGNTREYDVSIVWDRTTGGGYTIDAKIGYILNDEWEMQFFKCNEILPKKTGRYDNFVVRENKYYFASSDISDICLRNESDLKIVVCGYLYSNPCKWDNVEWEKFYVILNGYDRKQIHPIASENCRIDYVECY